MIKGEILGGRELTDYVSGQKPKLLSNLSTTIGRLVLMLQRNVKRNKLSGSPLRVRTGRLRRSINARMEGMQTPTVAGYVGTNVKYARPHEFGYNGTVKAHLRLVKEAFGRELKSPVWVNMPSRTVNLPERSFLRSSLTELGPTIAKDVRNAVTEAIK